MRILHILDHSIPLHSGYTFRTAAILREQRALGWETFHLTSPKHTADAGDEEDVDGLHFYRTPWMPEGLAAKPVARELALMRALETRMEQIVAQVRPDILHAHSPVLDAIPAVRVGRHRGIPVVYEVRAFWEDAAVDHGTTTEGSLRYRMTRALETWALKRADAVTCICEGLRADIIARGVPAERVTVVPNAVDIEKFTANSTSDAALKARLGLGDALVLGFIGSFYAYEGLDLLIRAAPHLVAGGVDVRVLLVGGGPQENCLKALVEELGLTDRVVFTGRVPNAEVASYYDVVDVLVYPRISIRLTELVTPLKPLEAMAQGRLVAASDVGGHRELIRAGETGILFPPGDPKALAAGVAALLRDSGSWPRIRRAARAFVERERNWKLSVSRYIDVYARAQAARAPR